MAGFFSPALLEQIRAASDIVDVIGSYLPLKRAGVNFVALCPFHKEKTPSFNVNPQRQVFHCFGCHKGGDVFTFLREYENLEFPEAVKRLADRARIPLEFESTPGEQQTRHLKDTLLRIHEQITARWQQALANDTAGQIARDYLQRRGVSSEAVSLFRLGYAPDLWDDTVNWAKSKGHDLAIVEKAGLILRKEGSEHYYDRFRGRLMFPICDEQARVIGFSGRILMGDEKSAKYVNSPETPIFTKSKVFFGLDKSKRALLDAGLAVVCEGQLDLIACFMAGVQNVVAPQGTAFTSEHARILKRYVSEVTLCFDSDAAGQNAAVRSLDHLLGSGLAVKVAVVPAPHDPDSFIKASGGEAFRSLIDSAQGFFDYYLDRLCRENDLSTDKGRISVLNSIGAAVQKTGNNVLIDTYTRKAALRLAVDPAAVRSEFAKLARSATPVYRDEGGSAEPEGDEIFIEPPAVLEAWFLKLLLTQDDLVPWVADHLALEWLKHPWTREAASRRIEALRDQTWTSFAAFLAAFPDASLQSFLTETATQDRPIPNPEQQLKDTLTRLRNEYIDARMAEILRHVSQPGIPESAQIELLLEKEQLRALKRQQL